MKTSINKIKDAVPQINAENPNGLFKYTEVTMEHSKPEHVPPLSSLPA